VIISIKIYFIKISLYNRVSSFFYPVTLRKSSNAIDPHLELFVYCNRLQLGTFDALYSDGDKYTPAVAFVGAMKKYLPGVKNILVLGAGIGSILHLLHKKRFHPDITFVDIDGEVLQWNKECTPRGYKGKIDYEVADAQAFTASDNRKFDVIFIDVFFGKTVPDFVGSIRFLDSCKHLLKPDGTIGMNYIINNIENWEQAKENFFATYKNCKVLTKDQNKILIGKNITPNR
jgi:spermidine synthase